MISKVGCLHQGPAQASGDLGKASNARADCPETPVAPPRTTTTPTNRCNPPLENNRPRNNAHPPNTLPEGSDSPGEPQRPPHPGPSNPTRGTRGRTENPKRAYRAAAGR